MKLSRFWQRALLAAWLAYIVVAFIASRGVPSIHYPPPVKVVEVLAIIALLVTPVLVYVRWFFAPVVLLAGCLGGILTAIWDARVAGQRGPLEIAVTGVLALVALTAIVREGKRAQQQRFTESRHEARPSALGGLGRAH